ncbi:TMV resistance protein N-like [Cynara cardunculus var. scolymus]|uniref:TMV resistance protein N-like n=1 Tax=Cynara cardunculus var. scolymus TaxID=59895 RepID=UPI000D62D33D|nr:TMV resistance protein N-like [Cynara cardunculus var. scolymus]
METQLPSSTYHIFLSFRGADTRKNFTDHLYTALCNAGFHTFRDDEEIQKGQQILPELEKAIKESSISVIVFSKHYGSSKWCLNELLNILERKRSDDRYSVFPIFYDVQPTEVGNQNGVFKEAFDKYEESGQQSKKKIEQWRNALKEVSKLTGKVLKDESNGHEAVFIQTIVKEVGIMLKRTVLAVAPYTVGIDSRVRDIDSWLKDGADVAIGVISGMRGIGKTTIAKVAYNFNFADFEASSFLANIRETSEQPNGLIRLQNQLLSDISKGKKQKVYNTDEGIVKIQDAICRKKILVVLDDVDQIEQIDTLIGFGDSLVNGSKIIITTSRERLLSHENHKSFRIKQLDYEESLRLFCWHAFSKDYPTEGYREHSNRVVQHCEGLPLALQIMGSSLFGRNSEFWESALEKLESIPDERIRKTLEVSYKSLHDDHDKRLFLMIAWSYVGKDMDDAVQKMEENDFYSKIGMQNLLDRSLISIDKDNKIVMHHLVHEMARAIIRQETDDRPGKRYLYSYTGAKTETVTSEGSLSCKNDNCGKRKRMEEDCEDESMPVPNVEGSSSFKRLCVGFFSSLRKWL